MAVPSPSVKPIKEPGGTHTYVYNGDIEQSGVAQDLNIDLTDIPDFIRASPQFQSQFYIVFKSLHSAVTQVGPAVLTDDDFHDDGDEMNAYVTVQVTSDEDTREVLILVETRHSAMR